jgi:hypothetical protein
MGARDEAPLALHNKQALPAQPPRRHVSHVLVVKAASKFCAPHAINRGNAGRRVDFFTRRRSHAMLARRLF